MKVWSWRQAIQKSSLASTTRLVLLNLSIYMNDLGEGCYPSTKQQSKDTGLSERALCEHLQIAEEAGFIKKNRHGFGGRAWNRQEYTACYPEGTDAGSASEPKKALTQSKLQVKKGADAKSVKKEGMALTQSKYEKTRGTDFDDIKALTLTTEDTDAESARIYSINSPINSPINSIHAPPCARTLESVTVSDVKTFLDRQAMMGNPIALDVTYQLEKFRSTFMAYGGKTNSKGAVIFDWVAKFESWLLDEHTRKKHGQESKTTKKLPQAVYIRLTEKIKRGGYLSADEKMFFEQFERQALQQVTGAITDKPPEFTDEKRAITYAWNRRHGYQYDQEKRRFLEDYEKKHGITFTGFENGQKAQN